MSLLLTMLLLKISARSDDFEGRQAIVSADPERPETPLDITVDSCCYGLAEGQRFWFHPA